jgi:hypothetical protein
MHKLIKFNLREPKSGEKKISYSQFAMYEKCPKSWELTYIQGHKQFSQNINTLFGTAFHETLQHYLTVMYTESVKKADELDIEKMLLEKMQSLYKKAVEEMGEHFSNKFELIEYYEDGIAILNYIKRHRAKYFSPKNEELIGIEVPIYHPIGEDTPIFMLGYLDVVLRDKRTDHKKIIDIKTSNMGWNKYQKADKIKASQLVLYKEYYAKQFGWDPEKIDIVYMIVKRKLIEGAMFPQKRVQEFIPASGKPTRNKLNQSIESFVKSSFKDDGTYNDQREYPAIAGKGKKNCKYCEFANKEDLCPIAKRICV